MSESKKASTDEILDQDKRLFPFLYQANPNAGILKRFDNFKAEPDNYLEHLREQEKADPSLIQGSSDQKKVASDPRSRLRQKIAQKEKNRQKKPRKNE